MLKLHWYRTFPKAQKSFKKLSHREARGSGEPQTCGGVNWLPVKNMKAESHLLESLNLISQQRMILCLFQSPTDSLSIQPGAALSCPLDLVTEKALYFHYAAIHSALTKRAKQRPFTQSILQNITALFNYSFQHVDRQGKRAGTFATGFTFFFYPPPSLWKEIIIL